VNILTKDKINWKSSTVLILIPLLTFLFLPYYAFEHGFCFKDWAIFGFFMISTGLSITAGYHRLWSHKAYKASSVVKIFFMLFGAAALQNSIIKWSSDHRKHHLFVDHPEKDPYAITKGFWYSHIKWMLKKPNVETSRIDNVNDLKKDSIVNFQHKYYLPISIFMCMILPTLIGFSYGSPLGCFLLSGLLRLVINHHFTFMINSIAHYYGSQNYSDQNTSRDNPLLSLFTYGEGYHNFHHKYPGDYRNGVHWYDYDPSKWLINIFCIFGLSQSAKKTSKSVIDRDKLIIRSKKNAKL